MGTRLVEEESHWGIGDKEQDPNALQADRIADSADGIFIREVQDPKSNSISTDYETTLSAPASDPLKSIVAGMLGAELNDTQSLYQQQQEESAANDDEDDEDENNSLIFGNK